MSHNERGKKFVVCLESCKISDRIVCSVYEAPSFCLSCFINVILLCSSQFCRAVVVVYTTYMKIDSTAKIMNIKFEYSKQLLEKIFLCVRKWRLKSFKRVLSILISYFVKELHQFSFHVFISKFYFGSAKLIRNLSKKAFKSDLR